MIEMPRWRELINPALDALRALGGSARPGEVNDWIVERLGLTAEHVAAENKNGVPTLYNRVAWARFYLAKADFLDSSRRGVWALTEKGRTAGTLSEDELAELQRQVQQATRRTSSDPEAPSGEDPSASDEDEDQAGAEFLGYRDAAKAALRGMSPGGFERFCQRLLREAGFESVEVTGKSGDGGIDGRGVLRVNPLASFNVVFQCKRYSSPVGSPEVRNFRGAMEGRADRGLLLATSVFSREAEKEAARDGVMPIELVDVNGIVDLMEELQLGLSPVSTFELAPKFFEDFLD